MTTHIVLVDEAAVAGHEKAADWWAKFRHRYEAHGRVRETKPGVVVVEVDSNEGAEWMARHLVVNGGLPGRAVRVSTEES